jgi:4-nitrophenyl phosphatase
MMAKDKSIQALLLDMDGVLWRDTEPIGDLPKIFKKIDQLGLFTAFVTNNATRSVRQYVDKLDSFGVDATEEQIVNSGLATALYLEENFPNGGPVFIIGESGLYNTLNEHGFNQSESDHLAEVASLDRDLTYHKLQVASNFIRRGVPFLGTNPDPSLPTPGGYVPGTGAILAALEAATKSKAIIMGKPSPAMYQIALDKLDISPEKALAVGDQMPTDIAAGIEAGCKTALVLSGVSDSSTASSFDYRPTYIAQTFAKLLEDLE